MEFRIQSYVELTFPLRRKYSDSKIQILKQLGPNKKFFENHMEYALKLLRYKSITLNIFQPAI